MNSWNLFNVFTVLCVYHVSGQFLAPGYGCAQLSCTTICPNGYTLDSRGCKTCTCATAIMNPGSDPVHQGGAQIGAAGHSGSQISPALTYTKPCILSAPCGITSCPGGFYTGPGGCQFCICAPLKSTQTFYTNPCSGAPSTCDAVCPNGFKTGSNGCNFCECATQTPAAITTTTIPTTIAMSKEDKCLIHVTECQLQHPHGFMTDRDCTMCVGKDEIYKVSNIPEERQPIVKLSNPCILGMDVCRIFCASGYKVGYRSCQYCACKNDNIWIP